MDNRIKELLARLNQATPTEGDKEKDFQQIWDLSSRYKEQATPNFKVEKNLSQLKQRIQDAQPAPAKVAKVRQLNILKIAAAIAFILLGTWVVNSQFSAADQWQWAENTGTEQQEILLQDGSTVQLYPGAKLGYAKSFKGQSERAVSLSGTAHFEVAHKPAQPFVIETNNTKVKVLGTQFTLAEAVEKQETTVTVEEGLVAFTDKNTDKTVEVGANQIGVCQKDGVLFQEATEIPDGPQIVQLRRETLARLVAQISRQQNWTITLDDGLRTCTITGPFDLNQPENALARIKELKGYEVNRIADNHYEIKGACK